MMFSVSVNTEGSIDNNFLAEVWQSKADFYVIFCCKSFIASGVIISFLVIHNGVRACSM